MTAVAGILQFDEAVSPDRVEQLSRTIAMPGHAPATCWREARIALIHAGRAGDPPGIHPATHARSPLVVCFEGQLDRRDRLARVLGSAGLPAAAHDAQLVLDAYAVWGRECVHHLDGEYAFAVWDAARAELFCVTDRFAACQFYFVRKPGFFAFASREEALLALPAISHRPDEDMIAQMLVPHLSPRDSGASWLHDVRILRPGESMTISADGQQQVGTYWLLQPSAELAFSDEREAIAEFMRVFEHAVRRRWEDSAAPSLLLSGGMDSASIRATMGRQSPANAIRSYSAVSALPAYSREVESIAHMSDGTDSCILDPAAFDGTVTREDFMREAWSRAHPRDNSMLVQTMLCLAGSRRGERSLQHGGSGDLTLRTPMRYAAQWIGQGEWRQAWHECQAASVNHTYLMGRSAWSLFAANAWTALVPGRVRAVARRISGERFRPGLIKFSDELDRSLDIRGRLRAQNAEAADARAQATGLQQDLITSLYGAKGLPLGLTGLAQLGKRFGLELRDPWADRHVVEFFTSLPLRFKIRDGWNKYFVREAFRADLHPQVLGRKDKDHLGWAFLTALVENSRDVLDATFGRDLDIAAPYIDLAAARARYAAFVRAEGNDNTTLYVHEVTVLVQWLKRLSGPLDMR